MSDSTPADRASASPSVRSRRWRPLIQLSGFVRKDLADIARQPKLVLLLIAGPFLILLLFAVGYDEGSVRLRTVFVAPEGSFYEEAVASYSDEISDYVEVVDFTSDVVAARERLDTGDVDLVVSFPPDPAAEILEGNRAVITVLHDKLDPIQQTAVEVSAQVAVQELNSSVLAELVGEAQESLLPLEAAVDEVRSVVGQLDAATDAADIEATSADLDRSIAAVDRITGLSTQVVATLRSQAGPSEDADLESFQTALAELDAATDRLAVATTDDEIEDASRTIEELSDELAAEGADVQTVDPDVVVRPFVADTENLLRKRTDVNDFFAPSSIALLMQHLALTLGALALVTDRQLGLFEVFKVGPLSAGHVLAGKYTSYFILSAAVAAILVAAVTLALDVPIRGGVGWAALGMGLLIVASIALGLLLSAVAGSDTQAVQYAMLALLAGMFFGGFFVSLDSFRLPVLIVSWALPVTHTIPILQDVMLRGETPDAADVGALVALFAVYAAVGWLVFRRRLKVV